METALERANYVVEESVKSGTVKIAHDVVAMIAGLAAVEVAGVAGTAGNVGTDLLSKVGVKSMTKGVRVDIFEKDVKANVAIVIDYGFNIPKVSAKVQEKVKQSIETMTGLNVTDVNVKIAGVNLNVK